MNKPIPIDLAHLNKITREDTDFQQELLEEFMKEAPGFVRDIQTALVNQDRQLLEYKAHQLKGSAATVAIFPLSDLAQKLEAQAKHKQIESPNPLVEEMETLLEQVREFIKTGAK